MNTSFADIEKKENRKDLIISICVFLSGFSCFAQLYYFQPLLPDLAKDFILSASESSFAISFSTLGMVFGLFTTMFVADRIPRKKMIGTGLLSSSIFSVAASFYLTGGLILGVFIQLPGILSDQSTFQFPGTLYPLYLFNVYIRYFRVDCDSRTHPVLHSF